MTLEISRGKLAYQYRISDRDSRRIEWRENKRGARWQMHSVHESSEAAQALLLKIDRVRGGENA